jgi:hypothetical protein
MRDLAASRASLADAAHLDWVTVAQSGMIRFY